MMRLGRRASLLVALYLLISAATASAECAWVLWLSFTHKTGLTDIQPFGAFDSKANCEEQRIARLPDQTVEALWKRNNNMIAGHAICLPDTLDPRGPKGSGR